MTVYLVIEHSGYDGDNYAGVGGIFFDKEKAKETFTQKVKWAKSDIGEWVEDEFVVYENYEFDETETSFEAWDVDRCSRDYINIWIEEREVE